MLYNGDIRDECGCITVFKVVEQVEISLEINTPMYHSIKVYMTILSFCIIFNCCGLTVSCFLVGCVKRYLRMRETWCT